MRLDFVELCGFRGFRDKLRLEFAPGFTVISGRNGLGKSTICDAIEFVITGQIDKYRVERAANESLSDYLWWRGVGAANSHYVTVGFVDADAKRFVLTRTREGGPSASPEEIEAALCVAGAKPDKALRQICRTSIIRDEWIAALSLDLTATERFELVRAALGAVESADYSRKSRDVLSVADNHQSKAEGEYGRAQLRLNQALTDLAEMRDIAVKSGDVANALETIDSEIGGPSSTEVAQRISAAREQLTRRRVRLGEMANAIEEAREIAAWRAEIDSPEFQTRKVEVQREIASLEAVARGSEAEVSEAQRGLALEQDANALATSLSALLEHGARIGLNHGHCPLCDAERTVAEFEQAIAKARSRLEALGSGVAAAKNRVDEKEKAAVSAIVALHEARDRLAELTSREDLLRARENANMDLFAQHDLDFATDPDALEAQLLGERSRLIDLERSILTLEASQGIERVTELEGRAQALRKEVDAAADRLAMARSGVTNARSIDWAVRRANAEIVDERLAMISPLLSELYQRLRPHPDWRSIQYSIRGDVRRFLTLKVGDGLNPQFVFSSGQRRAAGLAFLLSVYLSRPWCRWTTLLLDDPMQHIDDYRALHLVEVLAALRQTEHQIVCALEDPSLADLMSRRLLGAASAGGRRFDLDFGPNGAAVVSKTTEIPPMSAGVLRLASGTSEAG